MTGLEAFEIICSGLSFVNHENEIINDYEEECNIIEKALQDYDELLKHIKRWHDLLLKSGIDSKGIVINEIENYLEIKAGV